MIDPVWSTTQTDVCFNGTVQSNIIFHCCSPLLRGHMGLAPTFLETYCAFPDIHWQKIRTNNPLERIMREIRRRTRGAMQEFG
jgi:Transposase, Mutator family